MTGKGVSPRSHSQQFYFTVIIFCAILLFITFFSIFSYYEAKQDLMEREQTLREQTEKNLQQSVNLLDRGLTLFDATFDLQLQSAFRDFIAEYERTGNNPEIMDLYALKERIETRFDGKFDLYIIDDDGVIQYTTFENDLGLDFRQWPEVYGYLTEVRRGDSFSADRVVYGTTNVLRKYAYMPTPDHRYLLEIGLVVEGFKEQRVEFSYKKIAAEAVKLNPSLESVYFFDSTSRIIGKTNYTPDESVLETVDRVYDEKETREFPDAVNQTITRYLFIDLAVEEFASASEMNIVAQLTYSTSSLNHDLQELRTLHTFITVFALAVGVLFAFFTSRFITRPMTDIVDDVERIAGGDLDHTIRGGKGTEFQRLRGSINAMVGTLKGNLTTIRDSEAKIKCYSENLEKMVNKRTAQLQKSHEEMELYLDILTHKVNLSNTAITSYLHLLLQKLKSDQKRLAERALAGAEENAETIRNVEIIRRMYEEHLPTKEMDLDSVIAATAKKYPEWTIRTTGTGASVLADDLLPDVFANLIGNSVKFGGPEVEIWISAEDRDDEVIVSVEDNGPGIPDDIKRTVFESFAPGRGHVAGKGLGLHIVRSIIEWYGGKVWADDRVTGKPEAGAAIRFTLKKIR
jgi:two-component system sensor histidine kinase BarA